MKSKALPTRRQVLETVHASSPEAILRLLTSLREAREHHRGRARRRRRLAAILLAGVLIAALAAFNVLVWGGYVHLGVS